MFRKFMLLAGVVGMISVACADTIIPGGGVYGVWNAAGSPYLVQGSISVSNGQTLSILPGVEVVFQGNYGFGISDNGTLRAIGAPGDSIEFTGFGWQGIYFTNASDSCILAYCILQGIESTIWDVLYCNSTNLTLTNSSLRFCESAPGPTWYDIIKLYYCEEVRLANNRISYNQGFAHIIGVDHSNAQIVGNLIEYNTGGVYSAGIRLVNSSPSITGNILRFNQISASQTWGYGLIVVQHGCNPILTNNLISQNTSNSLYAVYVGGTSTENASALLINNSIINLGGCIYADGYGYVSGTGNILWGSQGNPIFVWTGWPPGSAALSYSDVQGGWEGIGNINQDPLFVQGPNGAYYLSQIAAGQGANSPCVDAGNPVIPIFGTTRTDEEPDTGVPDMGFHYPVPEPIPPPQTITLTPQNPPITIPPSGGRFAFEVFISNDTTIAASFDVWININVPGGIQFTILGPIALTLPANSSLLRMRTIAVPGSAPAGDYLCLGAIGDYPWSVIDSDQFPFTKLGSNRDWLGAEGWVCSGEPFDAGASAAADCVPASGSGATPTTKISPNPFNPTTVARYELPAASYVKLTVYDISGREVAVLVDGWREAGAHEVTFDASGLAAGIYFARLEAGEYVGVQKMVLLK